MPILYPSTLESIKFFINFVVRAAALAATWACLLAIGVGLNWLINWMLQTLLAPAAIARYSDQVVWFYIAILGIAATITSLKDVFILTKAGLGNSAGPAAAGAKDAEQKSPSD